VQGLVRVEEAPDGIGEAQAESYREQEEGKYDVPRLSEKPNPLRGFPLGLQDF